MKKITKFLLFFYLLFFSTSSPCFSVHPLIQAMDAYEHPKYLDADEASFIEVIKKYGSNVFVDDLHARLLHYAANKGYIKTIQILCRCGAQVNAQDCNGNTPLHDAVFMQNCLIVDCLLENNADPLIANRHGVTPIQVSFENKEIHGLLCKERVIIKNLKEKMRASL